VTNGLDTLTDTHRASQAAEQLLATLAKIRPAGGGTSSHTLLREEQMLSRIARSFHLPEERLRNRLTALRREARRRTTRTHAVGSRTNVEPPAAEPTSPPVRLVDLPAWDREMLELLLLEPAFITRMCEAIDADAFVSDAARQIFSTCRRLSRDEQQCDFDRILAALDDPDLQSLLVNLDEACANKASANREHWLSDLLETAHRRREEVIHRRDLAAARTNSADAERLLAQFCEQTKSKHRNDYERRKK
jgi:hypothetical protein